MQFYLLFNKKSNRMRPLLIYLGLLIVGFLYGCRSKNVDSSRIININGIKLSYTTQGTGKQCLVYGIPQYQMKAFSSTFKSHFQCIFIDSRFNDTSALADTLTPFTIEAAVEEIEAIREALKRVKYYRDTKGLDDCFIEIEVESLTQVVAVANFYKSEGVPDMILLDNMTPEAVAECVKTIRHEAGTKILIESSGGINSKNISAYIEAGSDVISTSRITLFATPLDISMKIVGYK